MKNSQPLIHLVRRQDLKKRYAWLIRGGAFALSILACAIISAIFTDKGMAFFFRNLFDGVFGAEHKIWNLFHETSILLLIALAVTPCFKMKFWNIGGEGQVLMGALGCSIAINFLGGQMADAGTITLSIIFALAFSVIWAVIPAIFKTFWNTNETLLTLMFNYIAVCLVDFFVVSVASSGTGVLYFSQGIVKPIAGNEFILKIIIAVVIMVAMAIYLRFSKHGYELTVVGESEKTARYIGINNRKVIIRTLILCGLICGIVGFLLVSATNHSLKADSTVGGRGFVGVLLAWLAHFNPFAMALTSLLYTFISMGTSQVGNFARLGSSYPDAMTGVFFFFIIASEFFINYKVVFRKRESVHNDSTVAEVEDVEREQNVLISVDESREEDSEPPTDGETDDTKVDTIDEVQKEDEK